MIKIQKNCRERNTASKRYADTIKEHTQAQLQFDTKFRVHLFIHHGLSKAAAPQQKFADT